MKPHEHEAAAQRIENSLRKCGPDDHEIIIEAAMLAGSHWLNAHLHRLGATQPTQDVMHTYLLVVNELRRLSVAEPQAVAALSAIEDLRPAYVRGAHPGGKEAGQRALSLLELIRASARAS
ncbi:MAG: hypothetical protein EOP82_14515 [Variovorax sp.]|nr:MAG: hypothetical protein EOP82_14515 [Variovorax sp.]